MAGSPLVVTAAGTVLPDGITSVERGDEMLWSEGTGRSATTGEMVGSVVAKKQTWALRWGVVTQAEYDTIRAIPAGFFALTVTSGGTTLASISAYRSNVSGEFVGYVNGTGYWRNVEVQLIER